MRALAGSHPGFRPVHAKGIVCSGTFRGAPEARRVSRAPHLQGQAVPTVIRFSNASGNPDVHDGLANPRALSVKFQLPDGQGSAIQVMLSQERPIQVAFVFKALRSNTDQPALLV
jgi:catalase